MLDPLLALVAIGQLTEINWGVIADHHWFPYNLEEGKIMVLPKRPQLIGRSASDVEVREGGRPEIM